MEKGNHSIELSWGHREEGVQSLGQQHAIPQGPLHPQRSLAPGPRWCACGSGSAGGPPPGWSAGCCSRPRRTYPWGQGVEKADPILVSGPSTRVQHWPRAGHLLKSQCTDVQQADNETSTIFWGLLEYKFKCQNVSQKIHTDSFAKTPYSVDKNDVTS